MAGNNPAGKPKGRTSISGQATQAQKRKIDVNIRRIFEEEAVKKDALAKAIRYMFEHDPVIAVHAYLKLLNTGTTTSAVSNVTNVFAEQINAPRIIAHVEELARLGSGANNEAPGQNQPVLLDHDDTGTH